MKIIILGAGRVGSTLAERLVSENNDITLVDLDSSRLYLLQEHLDIKTVVGNASYPDILTLADAQNADMLIAVTQNDEVNIVACQVAHTLFSVPKKIARIRSSSYTDNKNLFYDNAIPINSLISPEQVVTSHIKRLTNYPGALQVLNFANDKAILAMVRVDKYTCFDSIKLAELKQNINNIDIRVAAIFRQGKAIIPDANTNIIASDEIFFIAACENMQQVLNYFRKDKKPYKKIIIGGGGNIGYRLGQELNSSKGKYTIKIIEENAERACFLRDNLVDNIVVLHGKSSNKQLLIDERISDTDLFIAVTNDDEANIMSSLLAKQLGATKVMTLIAQSSYIDLINDNNNIDIAISPQQASINSLLTHVRSSFLVNAYSLYGGIAEAIEIIAHGNKDTSKIIGKEVEAIELPIGVTIIAIIRKNTVLIAHDDIIFEPEDHIILFLIDKTQIPVLENLFKVTLKET